MGKIPNDGLGLRPSKRLESPKGITEAPEKKTLPAAQTKA